MEFTVEDDKLKIWRERVGGWRAGGQSVRAWCLADGVRAGGGSAVGGGWTQGIRHALRHRLAALSDHHAKMASAAVR